MQNLSQTPRLNHFAEIIEEISEIEIELLANIDRHLKAGNQDHCINLYMVLESVQHLKKTIKKYG